MPEKVDISPYLWNLLGIMDTTMWFTPCIQPEISAARKIERIAGILRPRPKGMVAIAATEKIMVAVLISFLSLIYRKLDASTLTILRTGKIAVERMEEDSFILNSALTIEGSQV